MPKKYLAMKKKFSKNMTLKAAKTKAAKIFNASRKRGTPPVTDSYERDRKRKF